MDQRESASKEREPNSGQNHRQSFGAVANLVAALLDDATVVKSASVQPAAQSTTQSMDSETVNYHLQPGGQASNSQSESYPWSANGNSTDSPKSESLDARQPAPPSFYQETQLHEIQRPGTSAQESPRIELTVPEPTIPESLSLASRLPKPAAKEDEAPSVRAHADNARLVPSPVHTGSTFAHQNDTNDNLALSSVPEKGDLQYHHLASTAEKPDATESSAVEPSNPEPYQGDGMAINIKGRADGMIVEIGRGNWELLINALRNRLTQAGGFFRGGNVALDLADRSLQEADLHLICDALVSFGMKPALVRTSSDRTFQSALMLGLAGTLESKDGRPLETVQAAASNQDAQSHYVYRGALRSGQVLKRRSHVLIVGDVNAGAEVIATGDILVWGRLRGNAHAGAEGDQRAIVAAFDIDPVQLRIADVVALGNNTQAEGYRWGWARNTEKRPEVARLVNGQIAIEPWDEAKSGGAPVLKKRR